MGFFDLVNPHAKPPYRWWSVGPKRSGTAVHIDPLGTGAWNAVTHGRKRWVLFEPSTPSRLAKGKDVLNKDTEDDEAIMYFDFLLPRIKKKYPHLKVYEGLQAAGEIMFVPSEWWHGVLNLDDTVAITQNYCGYDNFDRVWTHTRGERKKLAHLWLRNMQKFAPKLFNRALELNARDGFRMRHEQAPDAASSDNGSNDESSSDSTSDEEAGLDLFMVCRDVGIVPPWEVHSPSTHVPAEHALVSAVPPASSVAVACCHPTQSSAEPPVLRASRNVESTSRVSGGCVLGDVAKASTTRKRPYALSAPGEAVLPQACC